MKRLTSHLILLVMLVVFGMGVFFLSRYDREEAEASPAPRAEHPPKPPETEQHLPTQEELPDRPDTPEEIEALRESVWMPPELGLGSDKTLAAYTKYHLYKSPQALKYDTTIRLHPPAQEHSLQADAQEYASESEEGASKPFMDRFMSLFGIYPRKGDDGSEEHDDPEGQGLFRGLAEHAGHNRYRFPEKLKRYDAGIHIPRYPPLSTQEYSLQANAQYASESEEGASKPFMNLFRASPRTQDDQMEGKRAEEHVESEEGYIQQAGSEKDAPESFTSKKPFVSTFTDLFEASHVQDDSQVERESAWIAGY